MKSGATLVITSLFLMGCLLFSCNRQSSKASDAPPSRPVAEVDTITASSQQIIDYREFTGRTAAIQSVEIRVQVNGYLLQSPQPQPTIAPAPVDPGGDSSNASIQESRSESFEKSPDSPFRVVIQEGERVKAGTPIFEIDPAPYRFALAQAEGSLVSAQAQRKRLLLDLARAKDLLKSNSISQAEYDLAVANEAETAGQIETLRAAVDRAKLNLQFTKVVSPIDGLLGRTLVTNGNLVSADSTILTTIVSTDPIHAYFDVDENSLLDYRARIRTGDVRSARESSISVQLSLANENGFPHSGIIDFVDNVTDSKTGNTRIRAQFPNDSGALSPGLFAKIRVPFTSEYNAVLIPTRALAMDQQGRYCMVIDNENVVHRRSVQVGLIRDSMTVITDGLDEGEEIVVSGLQKVREGVTVRKKPVELAEKAKPTKPIRDSESTQIVDGASK